MQLFSWGWVSPGGLWGTFLCSHAFFHRRKHQAPWGRSFKALLTLLLGPLLAQLLHHLQNTQRGTIFGWRGQWALMPWRTSTASWVCEDWVCEDAAGSVGSGSCRLLNQHLWLTHNFCSTLAMLFLCLGLPLQPGSWSCCCFCSALVTFCSSLACLSSLPT